MARDLSFADLAKANHERSVRTYGGAPEIWSLSWWSTKLASECGEVAQVVTRVLNGSGDESALARWLDASARFAHISTDEDQTIRGALADELADVVIVADLIAQKIGVELSTAVTAKFNATSRKKHSEVLL